MNPRSLEDLEKIEEKLLEIREILLPDDALTITETILRNFGDDLLIEQVDAMLKALDYAPDLRKKIVEIVYELQA